MNIIAVMADSAAKELAQVRKEMETTAIGAQALLIVREQALESALVGTCLAALERAARDGRLS